MHGTEADMAVPCRFVSITGSDGHVIQRLLAVADRPPQLRFRHGDRQHGFVTPFGATPSTASAVPKPEIAACTGTA